MERAVPGLWDAPSVWDGAGGDNSTVPDMPGPRGKTFDGPWLQEQVLLSLGVGVVSLLVFGVWKRWFPGLYLSRHAAQSAALPYARLRDSLFGWVMPTLLYSDHSVLHTVGLDGAVALLFLKMGFVYLLLSSLWAVLVLMPVHYYTNGWIDGVRPGETLGAPPTPDVELLKHRHERKTTEPSEPLPYLPLPTIVTRDTLYENTQLVSTYFYSLLALWVLWRTYTVFISFRQGHAGYRATSEMARTVEVRHLPPHLSSEDELRAYFSDIHLDVESIHLLQDTKKLDRLLVARRDALYRLEGAWSAWLGDASHAEHYDPAVVRVETMTMLTAPTPGAAPVVGAQVRARRARPTLRRHWWEAAVDAIDEYSYAFAVLDDAVRRERQSTFPSGHTAFVTFRAASSAQVASQVVHYPTPGYMITEPAVEPRDIIWTNEETSAWDRVVRQLIMTSLMALLLTLTLSIDYFLAVLVNMSEIKHVSPWLGDLLDESVRLRVFVQKSLPTLLLILINALVPVAMRYSTYFQRMRSHSRIDHSVLSNYYLYLLFSVVIVFLFTNLRDMLRELSQSPMHMIDKVAQSLPVARNFSLSYVVFQGLAIQPFQMVLLPTLLRNELYRWLCGSTPRARAHMFRAPSMSVGTLYPQALLVFTLAVLYSIVSPLITVFGAVYFGVAYLVLKYQLLNVLDKPYDSHGHAWPLAVKRCLWALVLFQVFQLSLFSVRKQVVNSLLIVPLIGYTLWFTMRLERTFLPLTSYVNLHDVYAVEDDTQQPRTYSDTASDDTTPIPASDDDVPVPVFEPPLSWSHPGLLSTGHDSYAQPTLTGALPTPWLPLSTRVETQDAQHV